MTEALLASLRQVDVEVDLGGRKWVIPAAPAADWFEAVLSNGACPIVPGMLAPRDEEDLIDLVLAGKVGNDELQHANHDALAAASGWNWWEAERLMVSIAHDWKVVGGHLLQHGIRLAAEPLGAVLAATYALATANLSKDDRFSFDARLTAPPVGYEREWFEGRGFAGQFQALIAAASHGG